MRLSEEKINDIRDSADIAEVIGNYLPLIKSGRNFKAVCPFHDDHDPSMNISVDKQFYKCFSCNAGGNVFTFVQKYENCSFIEAVKKVAEITGQEVDINLSSYEKPKDPVKENYYSILNETIKFLKYELNSSGASLIKEYLNGRGISDEIAEKFDIGYNGGDDVLYKFLSAKGYKDMDLIEVNVVRNSEYGIHDVFSRRITFPIHDILGNPIGFTARSIEEDVAKYINTNETSIYIKGNTVYNYHRAKDEAKRKGKVIVVEGVLDVIAFARVGIYNVVATLGTACTVNQLNEIRKLASTVVFCYDGDSAGQNANFKAGQLALKNKVNFKIIKNETEFDPDDIVSKFGAEALVELSQKEITWLEYCLDYYLNKYNLDLYSEKKEFYYKMLEEISRVNDEFDKQNFMHRLTQITGFKNNTLPSIQNKRSERVSYVNKSALEGIWSAERYILSCMINNYESIEVFIKNLGFLISDDCQILAMMIVNEYRKNGKVAVAGLIDQIKNETQKNILFDISTNPIYSVVYDETIFMSYIYRIKRWLLEDETDKIRHQINQELNFNAKLELMKKLNENLIELRRYNNGQSERE